MLGPEALKGVEVHPPIKNILAASAIATIATFRLKRACDYRIMLVMQRLTDDAMTALGGTTEVATLLKAPVSTVHSWKRKGISPSRLAHLKMAAQAAGKHIDWQAALEPVSPTTPDEAEAA